ncbi:MAG: AglZ/HisF2 family acetamidino modification protein [Ignavibacteria bacterium]|nr:AglZ/HisF2 family acetamidino modification protein [Ignavibacteria bacterium]
MLKTRVIPCLQIIDNSLVKTVKFKKYSYIGDPINTVRIFNELEVDELCFLDIRATLQEKAVNFDLIQDISDECFMPLSYGGGIKDFDTAKKILSIGFEKLVINTYSFEKPQFITQLADHFGKQSVIGSIDVKRDLLGKYQVCSHDGTIKTKLNPVEWATMLEDLGAGELLITSMDRDGTWNGYDIELVKSITDAVQIPVIALGGACSTENIGNVVNQGGASAVALGSLVVYQGKDLGVLVNFPDKEELEKVLD